MTPFFLPPVSPLSRGSFFAYVSAKKKARYKTEQKCKTNFCISRESAHYKCPLEIGNVTSIVNMQGIRVSAG